MDYFSKQILLPEGWLTNVRLEISDRGDITDIELNGSGTGAHIIEGIVIPGMPNLHSHAFQRAMAGLSEFAVPGENDFWSWRGTMYRIANIISPDQLQIIAAQCYTEMLKAGYTSVAEFHYLHHDMSGNAYAAPDLMSHRIIEAATRTGIGMTLLPVLYMAASFDGTPAEELQRRFSFKTDAFIEFFENLRKKNSAQLQTGIAFHSLRAVPKSGLHTVLDHIGKLKNDTPIHIHIAEQRKEVEDCKDIYGCTPVQWLFDNADIHNDWCLVHATHITAEELSSITQSQCVVGLCPTTEANLGDGIFPLQQYLKAGGNFGIGSDSHVSISPVEELRWLEYGQRLTLQKRNVSTTDAEQHTGKLLWNAALAGGAQAMARNVDGIKVGNRADLVVLDHEHPLLYGKQAEHILDAFVFAGNEPVVNDVMVGGQWVVKDGIHSQQEEISCAFKNVMSELVKKI